MKTPKTISMQRRMSLWLPLCLTAWVWIAPGVTAQTAAKYSLAVVPQYSAIELHKDWAPLLARISRDTGIAFELKVATSIPLFEASFLKGEPDFAYMNPYHAVMARKAQGYTPLLRDSKPLAGVLVSKKSGPYKTVKDLNGQAIGFPSPNAFGASLYMRALLTAEAGIKFEPVYLKTHTNVIRHVLRNEAAAGGTIIASFNDEQPEAREQLQVIFRTPEVASHPVVAHPRVPVAVQRALTEALLALSKDEAGRALLRQIRTPVPVPANYERDYRPLEKLRIEEYVVLD